MPTAGGQQPPISQNAAALEMLGGLLSRTSEARALLFCAADDALFFASPAAKLVRADCKA